MKGLFLLLVTCGLLGDVQVSSTHFHLPEWEGALKEIIHPNLFSADVFVRSFRDPETLIIAYLVASDRLLSCEEIATFPLFSKKHSLIKKISTEKGYTLIFEKDKEKCACKCCNPNPITVRLDYTSNGTALAVVLHRLDQTERIRNILELLKIEISQI